MKTTTLLLSSLAAMVCTTPAWSMSEHPPRFSKVLVDQLELRDSDEGSVLGWDASAWYGSDLNKLYLATEGERLMDPDHRDEEAGTESAETRLAWSHAFAPYWDW